ncbi:MAG TPA: RidA family protein [Gammaproteobacteria bacterium]|nr:RidA family protein [Gammaproteobacteria bacterium]
MSKQYVATDQAPRAIGSYSQAVKCGNLVFISGQIPLLPKTMEVLNDSVHNQIRLVFNNLSAVANAAGGSLADTVKLTVFLTNLEHFPVVNEVMAEFFNEPYPARAAVGVAALPKDVVVEIEAILAL